MGRIELTVCAARKLHDSQLIGMPDPFVRITCGDKKYKTPVKKNDLNPVWNETFRFQIPDENSTQIRMEVWNKNTYDDDLMGLYTLSLGGLTKGIVRDQWYILDKSKTQAELHVRLLAVDFGALPKPEEQWMVTTDILRDPVERAIADGTWRPGQKTAPPPSGPPTGYVQQPQVQQVIPQAAPPQSVTTTTAYVQTAPAPVQYVAPPPQPQPVQYVPQPAAYAPPQPAYYQPPPQPQPAYYQQAPPPPQPGYYQQPPPPQPGYYPQAPPPPQPGYYPQQPGYRY